MKNTSPSTEVLTMLNRLIEFKTVSRDSNLDLIEWAKCYLEDLGFDIRLTYNSDKNKANLFATIGSQDDAAGIVFSGHTDVVPIDGQNWNTDPFKATIIDNKVYGRGTCDMKGFVSVLLAKAPAFASAKLNKPVHFALSYDEEVGCLGVKGLLNDLGHLKIQPSGCIIGEPTEMKVITAHKGKRAYRCNIHGKEAHSSIAPKAVNAIHYAANLINHIDEVSKKFEKEKTWQSGFDIPFTTLLTSMINGGIATNVVPKSCEFSFEYRYLPDVDPDLIFMGIREYAENTLIPKMRKIYSDAAIEFDELMDYPGLFTESSHDLTQFVKKLTPNPKLAKVAFGTEAGRFSKAGIPSIVCGPGSIEQAHKPNEFITFEQLNYCESMIDNFLSDVTDE
ncbi:MAG: acetylornithine deacetylase [Arenicella sp.]